MKLAVTALLVGSAAAFSTTPTMAVKGKKKVAKAAKVRDEGLAE